MFLPKIFLLLLHQHTAPLRRIITFLVASKSLCTQLPTQHTMLQKKYIKSKIAEFNNRIKGENEGQDKNCSTIFHLCNC